MKYLKTALSVALAAASLFSAEAAVVKSLEALDNRKVYIIKRLAKSGSLGNLYCQEDTVSHTYSVLASNSSATTDPATQWAINYSEVEDAYFFYNMASGQFMTAAANEVTVSHAASRVMPIYLESAGYWIADLNGFTLGQAKADAGQVIFTDEITKTNYRECGLCFSISDVAGVELTDEQLQLIKGRIWAGRAEYLDKYVSFVEKAEKMLENSAQAKFAGAYDVSELKTMLQNPDHFSIKQFEEAYNRAVIGRIPSYGYYRLRNNSRPSTYSSNLVVVAPNGQLNSVSLKEPKFGQAGSGRVEDLSLFSLIPVNGDPNRIRLRADATGKYVVCGSGNNSKAKAEAESTSGATIFRMDPPSETLRVFRFGFEDNDNFITVSGSNELVAYSNEPATRFYFEKVQSVSVTTDANGYASLILPANISLPEGVQAWVVTSVRDGKAYCEEAKEGISAKIPFIMKGAANTAIELPLSPFPTWYASAMDGSCIADSVGARQQVVSTPTGFEFQPVPAGQVAPGSAFILTDDVTPLTVVMGADPESGIQEIAADSKVELFDLQGRRVAHTPRPGLYIDAVTKKVVRVK